MVLFNVCSEKIWKLVSYVYSHGIHPEEEADEGVVGDVAKEHAEWSV